MDHKEATVVLLAKLLDGKQSQDQIVNVLKFVDAQVARIYDENLFVEKPLEGVLGWGQMREGPDGQRQCAFSYSRDDWTHLGDSDWKPVGDVFPVGRID